MIGSVTPSVGDRPFAGATLGFKAEPATNRGRNGGDDVSFEFSYDGDRFGFGFSYSGDRF